VLLVTFMFCGALFQFIHLWAIGVFVFLFVIEWCITKHDDRAFRILYLAWKTKIVNRSESSFTNLWGGSSYSPRDYGDQD
jgi:type IV secretion system protein VirB3